MLLNKLRLNFVATTWHKWLRAHVHKSILVLIARLFEFHFNLFLIGFFQFFFKKTVIQIQENTRQILSVRRNLKNIGQHFFD